MATFCCSSADLSLWWTAVKWCLSIGLNPLHFFSDRNFQSPAGRPQEWIFGHLKVINAQNLQLGQTFADLFETESRMLHCHNSELINWNDSCLYRLRWDVTLKHQHFSFRHYSSELKHMIRSNFRLQAYAVSSSSAPVARGDNVLLYIGLRTAILFPKYSHRVDSFVLYSIKVLHSPNQRSCHYAADARSQVSAAGAPGRSAGRRSDSHWCRTHVGPVQKIVLQVTHGRLESCIFSFWAYENTLLEMQVSRARCYR